MPYVFKPNKLYVKNPEGSGFLPQNIITDQTTEEMIAQVEAAGASTISEVQQAVSDSQNAVAGIDAQRDTIIASIASVAGQGTDTTLTQSGVAADAKAAGDTISDLKGAIDIVTADVSIPVGSASRGYWEITNNVATKQSASSGFYHAFNPITVSEGQQYKVVINCNSSYAPIILADYTNNQYAVVDTKTVTAQRTPAEFDFIIPSGVTHMLLTRFGNATPGATVTLKVQRVDTTLSVAGVAADAKATGDAVGDIASYVNIFDGNFVNKIMSGSTPANSPNSCAYMFSMKPGYYYKVTAKRNNRFIAYGSNSSNSGYTEITRITTSASNEMTFAASTYTYGYIQIQYLGYTGADDYDFALYEKADDGFGEFKVKGVSVYTTDAIDELLDSRGQKMYLRATNIKMSVEGPENAPTNLILMAVKSISKVGCVPDVEGYLYYAENTAKFYYSNGTPDNPVFLFDWNASLANNEVPGRWQATITADGDVIFCKYWARTNPVVYPHGDYAHPYVVDFGSDTKPYGWLVNSSVVQLPDGSFVYGDYAAHSLEGEQAGSRRIIWHVSKPYNDKANWVQAHSFKHVYFTSHKSDEPDNEIGHIHAVMFDHYDGYLYCTTGDIDRHCRMWVSTDNGVTWAAVPGAVGTTEDVTTEGNGQKWRMTNGVFTKDAMWWATDAATPQHKLYKCTRGENGHIDFSTIALVKDIEIFGLSGGKSQRTYITALCRNPDGLLLIDRGEPRGDKLEFTFFNFADEHLYIISEYERADNTAGDLESANRLGLPMQCTTPYMPQTENCIITGGGKYVRPNNTGIFNNSLDAYVGAIKLTLV